MSQDQPIVSLQSPRPGRRGWLAGMAGVAAVAGLSALPPTRAAAEPTAAASLGGTNVKDHGAVGDGKTVDTGAIEAAIAEAGDSAVIYFPPGNYRIHRTLFPRYGQRWIGVEGHSLLTSIGGVEGFTLIDTRHAHSKIAFDGLVLDGNRENTTDPGWKYPVSTGAVQGVGIFFIAATKNSVEHLAVRCHVRNTWNYGIAGCQYDKTGTMELNVEASRVTGCGGGVVALRASRLRVLDCVVENNGQQGIWGQQCADVIVGRCTASGHDVHGIVFTYSSDLEIIGNKCHHNGQGANKFGWGICLGGSSLTEQPNQNFTITGNRCDLNGSGGITMDPKWPGSPQTHSQRAAVVGNVCTSDGVVGINGISLNYAKDVTVTGNVCQGMPYHGINISYPDRAVVTGNVSFENNKGLAIDSTDHGVSYGNVVVGNNMIYDNETDYHIPEYDWSGNIALAEPLDVMQILADKVGFYGVAPTEQPTGYAAIDRVGNGIDFNPKTAGAREISDTLAALIGDLKRLGLIG